MNQPLGEKLRGLRKSRGLTLEALANRTGISKSYIWELENKTPPSPSAEKLLSIAKELDVTLEYLLAETSETEAEAEDQMFFRKYQKLPPNTKTKLMHLVDLWDDED